MDGLLSDVVIVYHGQQLAYCKKEVKEFVCASSYFRVAAFQSLDSSMQLLSPLHDCCNLLQLNCQCAGSKCNAEMLPFEIISDSSEVEHPQKRTDGMLRWH